MSDVPGKINQSRQPIATALADTQGRAMAKAKRELDQKLGPRKEA